MVDHVERLLALAEELVAAHPRSSAAKRRAVSTAYYAAFHALMRICADALIPGLSRESVEYERVYRAIDHGSMKNAFQAAQTPLKQREALAKIGNLIVPLQSERMRADYSPPRSNFYDVAQARSLIAQARKIVADLNALQSGDRLVLAVHLIFKDRSK